MRNLFVSQIALIIFIALTVQNSTIEPEITIEPESEGVKWGWGGAENLVNWPE